MERSHFQAISRITYHLSLLELTNYCANNVFSFVVIVIYTSLVSVNKR